MSRSTAAQTVFLDMDGTLTNSRLGISRCIVHALTSMDCNIPPQEELDEWIGPPLLGSFESHLGSASAAEKAVTLYRERFSRVGILENELYPGIESALNRIRRKGFRLYVVTSKPQPFAERIVLHFGLMKHFDGIYGSDLQGERSDKSVLIRHALRSESIDASLVTMIGDRKHDVIGARENAVTSIAVLWGFGSREELSAARADHLCERVDALPAVVDTAFAA